jgi:hypothetical protein
MTFTHELVSVVTSESRLARHKSYADYYRHLGPFGSFMNEVERTLDVKLHMDGSSHALVYREGDIHVLGEIGYSDVRVRGSGESKPQFYVRTKGIVNDKYKHSAWQHNIVTTKSLRGAVKLAKDHLIPITPRRSLEWTAVRAKRLIEGSASKHHDTARRLLRDFSGETGYGQSFDNAFWREVRNMTFIDPTVRATMANMFEAVDNWREAMAAKGKTHFVGFSDNYGQLVAHTAGIEFVDPMKVSDVVGMDATTLPDWMRGRIAVLQMTEPDTYVDGVGLRMDDKVYYIMEDNG